MEEHLKSWLLEEWLTIHEVAVLLSNANPDHYPIGDGTFNTIRMLPDYQRIKMNLTKAVREKSIEYRNQNTTSRVVTVCSQVNPRATMKWWYKSTNINSIIVDGDGAGAERVCIDSFFTSPPQRKSKFYKAVHGLVSQYIKKYNSYPTIPLLWELLLDEYDEDGHGFISGLLNNKVVLDEKSFRNKISGWTKK